MELLVVLFTEWNLEPGYVVLPAGMVLFDVFGRPANHADRRS